MIDMTLEQTLVALDTLTSDLKHTLDKSKNIGVCSMYLSVGDLRTVQNALGWLKCAKADLKG